MPGKKIRSDHSFLNLAERQIINHSWNWRKTVCYGFCNALTAYCSELDWRYLFGLLGKDDFSEEKGVRFLRPIVALYRRWKEINGFANEWRLIWWFTHKIWDIISQPGLYKEISSVLPMKYFPRANGRRLLVNCLCLQDRQKWSSGFYPAAPTNR